MTDGALTLGVRLSEAQTKALHTYLVHLKRWNLKVNLTGLKGDEEIIEKHFLDSLGGVVLLPPWEEGYGAEVLDIGSGAGFPGLVFKIVRPDLSLSLLEPTGKKAAFLHHIIGQLKLKDIRVISRRLEALGPETGPFDLCVSRALASPRKLLDRCRPLIKEDGRVILYEGRPRGLPSSPADTTFPNTNNSRAISKWSREAFVYRLPFSGIFREIGVYNRS
ncbi:MAG TPA: 16S rRNA (guanine(527)-N(7))-methyltransferase RsmG [Nitrospiria bacterium]